MFGLDKQGKAIPGWLRLRRKKSRRPTSTLARVLPVVTVLALAGVGWLSLNMELLPDLTAAQQKDYRPYAMAAARQVEERFAGIRDELNRLVVTERLNQVAPDTRFTVLDGARWQLPHLMRARLISNSVDRIDDDVIPVLSYACQDMLKVAQSSDATMPFEVHSFGSPQQHIDVVRRVQRVDGTWSGAVIAAYNVALLQQVFSDVDDGGAFLELQQGQLTLATHGKPVHRIGAAVATIPVLGTAWQVAVWSPAVQVEQVKSVVWQKLAILIALTVTILVVAGVYGWREHKRLAALPDLPEETGAVTALQESGEPLVTDTEEAALNSEVEDLLFQAEGLIVVDEDEDESIEAAAAVVNEIDASIFKAYDIRGVVDETLTASTVRLLGQALGSEARARGQRLIAVGRDGRNSGPQLVQALIAGLQASGINVLDVGMVPTPVLYYAAWEKAHATGVMLTGSHNPPGYNGLKMVIGGSTLAREDIQRLRQRVEQADFSEGAGTVQQLDVIDAYIERIVGHIMLLRHFKVVIDCGNGVAGLVAPKLFKAMGCEVTELYSEVDGNFPHHHPDPSRPENLQTMIDSVRMTKADIGLAFDGDGDRLGVVTGTGKIVWPDRVMMLYVAEILKRNPGAEIIFDVKCSRHLATVIEKFGGKPVMWNTGHSLIKAKMKETGAPLGGEMSGHLFFKDRWYGFDDALYAAARLLELLGPMSKGGPVNDVFTALPDSVNTPELNLHLAEGQHHAFMKKFLDKARFKDAHLTTIDGLRADFKDGWGLVRASNTTPSLVLRFEADSRESLERIKEQFRIQMRAVDDNIELAF